MWWTILFQFISSIIASLIAKKTAGGMRAGPGSLSVEEIDVALNWWTTILMLLPKLQAAGADVMVIVNIIVTQKWADILPALEKLLVDLQTINPPVNPPVPL